MTIVNPTNELHRIRGKETAMETIILIAVYVVVAAVLQLLGYAVSLLVDLANPAWGLLSFLLLFLSAFWLAWPIAVWVTEPKTLRFLAGRR
jgi:hypothetical protein